MMIFVPYQLLVIQKNINNLPLVLGVGILFGGLSSMFIGRLSDKNRKGTFAFGILFLSLIILAYNFANSLVAVIILQALYGIAFAFYNISEKAIIADLAVERGKDVGKYATALYTASGLALIITGLFVIPSSFIFYIVAIGLLIPNIIILKAD